jgi:flagellar export protein FliJ
MRQFRLGAVLRARQVQEDTARAEVVRARRVGREARQVVAERRGALEAGDVPNGASARAVVAALVARQSLAAGLAAARHDADVAEAQVDARLADLAEAAKRRRGVEKLAERHAAAERARAEAADQRALDEIAVTAATRRETLA